jgi:hypothetical protein
MRTAPDLSYVEAEMEYLSSAVQRPHWTYYATPQPGVNTDPPEGILRKVRIHNMRPIASDFSLDREGFVLIGHSCTACNFWDQDEVRRIYYPEIAQRVRDLTGARCVLVFDHLVRGSRDEAKPHFSPVRRIHIDRSHSSIGPSFIWRTMRATRLQRVRELLGRDADELLQGRMRVVTFWRPIREPVTDSPLALCDAESVDPRDLVLSEIEYDDRVAEGYSVIYNPAHRWYYAPDMSSREAFLITCSDTKKDGCAQFVPHASFDDPTAPTDAPARQSIEARMLLFHPA